MKITRAADYAMRVMLHLAGLPSGTRVQRSALAQASDVPEPFLSKVLQRLVGANMVISRRGGGGGFELALPPGEITVWRVVEAIDGTIRLNHCMPGDVGCARSRTCAVHPVWLEAQTALAKVLQESTLAALADRQRDSATARPLPPSL